MNVGPLARARAILSRVRDLFVRGRLRDETDEEMRTHLEYETRYNIERGMAPDQAARAARLAFGSVQSAREEVSDRRGFSVINQFARDARFAVRQLRRSPAFTLSVVATLAIGIGATTSVFTVLNSVLLKPLPYPNADRLVGLWWAFPGMGFERGPQSLGTAVTIQRFAKSFDDVAVYDRTAVNVADDARDAHPERIFATRTTASMFGLLGATFVAGHGFGEADDSPRAPPVAVISEGLWRRRFGAQQGIVGQAILIDNRRYTIVGVAASRFAFPDRTNEVWLPLGLDPSSTFGGSFTHAAFARLKPGVSPAVAERELTQLIPRVGELYPELGPGTPTTAFLAQARARALVTPMQADVVRNFGSVVSIAGAAGILLFLISFANVAGLLLARAQSRRRELAVRLALGAGARRVIAQFLAESTVLAIAGGALGVVLSVIGLRAFVRAGPPGIPRLSEIGVDPMDIAFAIAVTLALALLCSLAAGARFDRLGLSSALREGPRGAGTTRDRQRARRVLVVSQVAFATILVGGAALMLQSVQRLRHSDPGFDARHALTLWLSLPQISYPTDRDIGRYVSQTVHAVEAAPGVRAAGVTSKLPLFGLGGGFTPIWTDRDQGTSSSLPPARENILISGGYFSALGIPLVAGHTFQPLEHQSAFEVIVDRRLATEYWGDSTGQRAVGRRLRFAKDPKSPSYTVIGVVGSVADTSLAARDGVVYLPSVAAADSNFSSVVRLIGVVARGDGDPRTLVKSVEQAIATVDRTVPPFEVQPLSDVVEGSTARLWFIFVVVGVTACVAIVLAGIGLYGMLAFMVSTRAKELSLRIAMGAVPAAVAGLVARQGAGLAAAGVLIGGACFIPLSRYIASLLDGVMAPAPSLLVLLPLVLLAVAFFASWVPARRASRADPARVLASD